MRQLKVDVESWPIAGAFTISRGSRTEARVVVATIEDGAFRGRGECVPYPRYGETVEGVAAAIESFADAIANGANRADLPEIFPAGAARNALDCALWDLEAKVSAKRAYELAGGSSTPAGNHRLHAEPWLTGVDGSGGKDGKPQAALEGEAWRRRRRGTDRRYEAWRTEIDPDR